MDKIVRMLLLATCILLAVCAAGYAVVSLSQPEGRLELAGERLVALNAAAAAARSTDSSRVTYMFFRFTRGQSLYLNDVYSSSGGAAVQVDFRADEAPADEAPFGFGFLYAEDLDGSGRVLPSLPYRRMVQGDFSRSPYPAVTVSQCLRGSGSLPVGFFVYGRLRYRVDGVQVTRAKIGWDVGREVPLFALGPSGGQLDFGGTDAADFGDGAEAFGGTGVLPCITLGFRPLEDAGTWRQQPRVEFSYGEERFTLRRTPAQRSFVLQAASFREPFGRMAFQQNAGHVSAALMTGNSRGLLPEEEGRVLAPLETDLGMIYEWPRSHWRSPRYELYRWQLFPQVLFFDFADYDVQNRFFTRLAYFVEKQGYIGTLVGSDFVLRVHGYNAHDYKADDLAAFFTKAAAERFPLFEEEYLLRDILLHNGVIAAAPDGAYAPGAGAVISFSRQTDGALRHQLLAHESWHGIYFTDAGFRDFVARVYAECDPQSVEFLKQYWASQADLNYDRSNEYLMQNEFMAYIMQQGLGNIAGYFVAHARWNSVARALPRLSRYIQDTGAAALVDAGARLNDYAFDRWGLGCGRVTLIAPL